MERKKKVGYSDDDYKVSDKNFERGENYSEMPEYYPVEDNNEVLYEQDDIRVNKETASKKRKSTV